MPHVEVLPTSTSIKAPGWALVPDTAIQTPAQQTSGRKRAARSLGLAGGDTTVRQQNAILKHLADLDKDSHRDVQIPVPKDNGKVSKKTTQNVRRILMSQKTFTNHLADEEAAVAQQHHGATSATTLRTPAIKPTKSVPNLKRGTTSENQSTSGPQTAAISAGAPPVAKEPLENDPLLRTYVPSAPSNELMDALLSAPPLSYNAARTAPPPAGKPQRQFCEICGYWGTTKCMKCGVHVCSLECKGAHDDGRCLKYYG